MHDRTIKALLGAIVALLLLLLVKPSALSPAALAQGAARASGGDPAIASENGLLYVVKGNEASVYYLDLGSGPLEALKLLGDEKAQEEVRKRARLKLLLRQDLDPGAPIAAPDPTKKAE